MKIIAPGNTVWGFEAVCTGKGNGGGGCGARLQVEAEDLFKTFVHSRDETDTYITFKRPQCGTKTDTEKCPPSRFELLSEKDHEAHQMKIKGIKEYADVMWEAQQVNC